MDVRADVTVRPAVPEDAPAVARVHARAGRAAWSSFLGDVLAVPDVDVWRRRVALPDALVAERGGQVVGFGAADASTGEVSSLYVDPDEQGRGTGRLLLARLLERLRSAGHRAARLHTEERNTGPRRFYEDGGWRTTGRVRERVWEGRPLRELEYELDLG